MNKTVRGKHGDAVSTRAPVPPKDTPRARTHGARGIPLDDDWQERFLAAMLEYGARWKAARVAGVSTKTVNRYEEIDPEFSERIEDARQEFVDELEVELREMGRQSNNPLGHFGLLKRHRPYEWNDKLVSVSVNVDAHVEATAEQAKELLAAALGLMGPATREALMPAPTTIDVTATREEDASGP